MVIGEFTCGSGRRSGSWSPPPPSSCNSSPAASSMESWRQRASPNPKSGPRSTGTAGADQEAPHWQRSVFVWQGGFHSFHVTIEKNNWVGGSQTEWTAAVNSYRFGDAIWNCQSSIPIPIVYWCNISDFDLIMQWYNNYVWCSGSVRFAEKTSRNTVSADLLWEKTRFRMKKQAEKVGL